MSSVNDAIRTAVKVALVKRKMTQAELAERIGLSRTHISRMMQGHRSSVPPSWQLVFDELGLELVAKDREG